MSHTFHARRGRVYDGNHGSPYHRYRGGSSGIAWRRKYMSVNGRLARYLMSPAERTSDDLAAQVHDAWLAELGVELDREISESVKQEIARRRAEHEAFDYDDYYDPYQRHDWHWEVANESDDNWQDYLDHAHEYDREWSDDPRDAGWVGRWVDGDVDTPTDWWSREYDLADYYGDDDLDEEIREHLEWLCERDEPILVVEAADIRNTERKRAGDRHYKCHRRAA